MKLMNKHAYHYINGCKISNKNRNNKIKTKLFPIHETFLYLCSAVAPDTAFGKINYIE